MQTYQDLLAVGDNDRDRMEFVFEAIRKHQASNKYIMAKTAERYYKEDTDMARYQKYVTNVYGKKVPDIWSANNRICSNWHFYFVTQEVQYLLGNGVNFENDQTAGKLDQDFDVKMRDLATKALNTSCAFGFWNHDHIDCFSLTEFVPLYDELDGMLKAGVRFWCIDDSRPLMATLYEMDGITEYKKDKVTGMSVVREKRPYKQTYKVSVADGAQLVAGENYDSFPIVPLHNVNDKSELDGKKSTLDAYDLLTSKLVNGATQADFIYWVFKNCGGLEDQRELQQAIEELYTSHGVSIGTEDSMEPHQLTMPHEGTIATLERIENQLYHDYMGLKTTDIAAGAVTATQIRAAYEPLMQKTSLFEQECTRFIRGILDLAGLKDKPSYPRMGVANRAEDVQTLLAADTYIDDETMVNRLTAVLGFPEKAAEIYKRLGEADLERYALGGGMND